MKYIFITLLVCVLSNANAQLVKLPKSMLKVLAENLDKSTYDQTDSVNQYSFELEITVKPINADSAVVTNVRQLKTGNTVHHFSDLEFIKKMNFAFLTKNKKIHTIHIPCFYSLINRIKAGSERRNDYLNFWNEFDDLFVRKTIRANELYTEPVTVFGYIYQ